MSKIHTGKQTFKGQIVQTEATIVAASTTDLATLGGNIVSVTGNTTITGFGTVDAGTVFVLTFVGTPVITYNVTSLILPGAVSITAAAGDVMTIKSLGSGNWKCIGYERADGKPVVDDVSKFVDTTYPAGETLSAGNVVFIENAPTTAQATSAQNIGDVTANTRVSFPVFGSGVAGSTTKLNLAKVGSPSVAVQVRIETDNAGSPSGTLVDANATGTLSSTLNALTDTSSAALDATYSQSDSFGYRIFSKNAQTLGAVTMKTGCTANRCRLFSDAGALLETKTITGLVATFTYVMSAGTYYRIEADSSGSAYTTVWCVASPTYPMIGTNINFVSSSNSAGAGTGTSQAYNILSIYTTPSGSLTTSLADTTVTLGGSFTIPAGQKCHTVISQVSDTVNASNYYKVGYSTNDSTTRIGSFWNGSVWTLGTKRILTESSSDTPDLTTADTVYRGYRVKALKDIYISTVTKHSTCTATTAYIQNDAGTVLDSVAFSGNTATFTNPIYFLTNTFFKIVSGSGGASYTATQDNSPAFPNLVNIDYDSGAGNANGCNIASIGSVEINQVIFPYTSSTIFNSRVLSKTDADFSYKIDWHGISQEAVTAGDLATGKFPKIAISGVDSNQTGMTQGATQYLGNTPGSISSSAGTNSMKIGTATGTTKIQIEKSPVILPYITITDGTTYYASTSGFVTAWVTPATNQTAGCSIVAGTTSSPTDVVGRYGGSDGSNDINSGVTAPIPKGYYYKCTSSGTLGTAVFRFYPLS